VLWGRAVQEREQSYRLYSCRGCSVSVSICGRCDRGNIYCAGECAAVSRRASNRRAGARYQRTRRGARRHAARQQAHFGTITIGKATRPLMAFVMVLSYSRHLFLRFYLNGAMNNFLRGHVEAFSAWGAVPRVVLYDNLRSAVLERRAEARRVRSKISKI
jgi:transposase